ncbi:MAG: hypothetical protein AB7N80_08410 [Bdellovibrionales bacterium]
MSAEKLRLTAVDLAGQDFLNCSSLKDLVAQIETQVRSKGRVVCSVAVNGLHLNEADELRLGSTLKQDIDFIEVEIEQPDHLLRSTVVSQIELMQEIDRVAQAAAEAFRQLDLSRGHDLLISMLDGCRWFTDSLVALRDVLRSLNTEGMNVEDWKKAETELHAVLSQVLAAVESSDRVLLADILEYELANSLEKWHELLSSLR